MEGKKLNFFVLFLGLILSCSNNRNVNSIDKSVIKCRNYYFTGKISYYNSFFIDSLSNNKRYYSYHDDYILNYLFYDDRLIFNKIECKLIDKISIKFNSNDIFVYKFYHLDKQFDKYIYMSKDLGIISIEHLAFGMYSEYNLKVLNELHKNIFLKNYNFKNGPYEPERPKIKYIDY